MKQENKAAVNAVMEIASELSARDLIIKMGLSDKEVEAVFINGKIKPLDAVVKDGDRVALMPNYSTGPQKSLKGLDNITKAL